MAGGLDAIQLDLLEACGELVRQPRVIHPPLAELSAVRAADLILAACDRG